MARGRGAGSLPVIFQAMSLEEWFFSGGSSIQKLSAAPIRTEENHHLGRLNTLAMVPAGREEEDEAFGPPDLGLRIRCPPQHGGHVAGSTYTRIQS